MPECSFKGCARTDATEFMAWLPLDNGFRQITAKLCAEHRVELAVAILEQEKLAFIVEGEESGDQATGAARPR